MKQLIILRLGLELITSRESLDRVRRTRDFN